MAQASRDVAPSANPISSSEAGDSQTGFGCFPLGKYIASSDFHDLVSALGNLRTRNMLSPLSHKAWTEMRQQLGPLEEAQAFWSRNRRDAWQAVAIHELMTTLFGKPEHDAEEPPSASSTHNLEIWHFPASKRLTSAQRQIWGLHEIDMAARTTHLYVSSVAVRFLPYIVLHTFLSSRQCNRTQCFLAEYVLADQANGLTDDWELPHRFQNDIDLLSLEELEAFMKRLYGQPNLESPVLQAKLAGYCEDRIERTKSASVSQ
jgi:hypothetical protein